MTTDDAGENTLLRALFFEDNREDIDLSLRALKAAGFDVVHDMAVTPEELLERAGERSYDIILSDYRMPGLTGLDAYQLLKKAGVAVPFILVTGSLGDEKCVQCLKEGVADYVLKDRLACLPAAIRRALEDQRVRREHELAEQALRRSQAGYYSLIQSAPCGILRLSARDGRLLEVNAALSEMLGYASPAELIGNSTKDGIALPPELLLPLSGDGGPAGQGIQFEVQWKRRDGAPLRVELRGRLLRDEDGGLGCLEMIAENITERHRAQERIRQLNGLYAALSQAGRAIVHIRSKIELFQEICRIVVEEGHFQLAWVGLVHYSQARVTPVASCPGDDIYLRGLHLGLDGEVPGRGPVACAVLENRRAICNDLATDWRMRPWRERAGNRGYRSVGAFPLTMQGGAIGAIALYSGEVGFFDEEKLTLLDELAANVSFALESMEAERMRSLAVDELDQFFALSLDMLCIFSLDGYIRRLNPAWEKTLGFTAAELCSQPWTGFVHPDDRPRAEATLQDLQSGVEIGRFEFRFLSKSGDCHCLLGSTTPALEQNMLFAVVTDITERKYLEEQLCGQNLALEDQNRRVSEASRLKSEFLANMSHELRSPLNGVIGFTELLYDGKLGPLPERPREVLGRVHASASHLLQLINRVLDLSKVEAGRLELQPERVSLSSLIHEVTGILGPMANEKQIRIEIAIDQSVDDVTIDAGRLKQILYNYLSNALKFTGPGGRVEVELSAEGDGEFRLAVSDTGVGISASDLGRLFVDFQQLDASASKRYQGTGLGLALTKRLVEAQGGRVGAESTPGQGSTFFVVLPRVASTRGGVNPTVLAIEDQNLERVMLARILRGAGYAVETAANGEEALDKCYRWSFDAITLDLPLPDGTGWELLGKIRSIDHHRNTPVVVISMLKEDDLQRIPFQVQAFLTKPVDGAGLLAVLERIGLPIRDTKDQNGSTAYSNRG